MEGFRRVPPPSNAASALQQLAAKREQQEAKRAMIASRASAPSREDKENDEDLNDFESPEKARNPAVYDQQHAHRPRSDHRANSSGGDSQKNIDALTGTMSSMAIAGKGRVPPPGSTTHLVAASQLPLPSDSDEGEQPRAGTAGGSSDTEGSSQGFEDCRDSEDEEGEEGQASTDAAELLKRIQRHCQPAGQDASTTPAATAAAAPPMVLGDKGEFQLDGRVAAKLYPHQVEGVKWLWSLHQLKRGGILGDDMGLGKTMQCSAFLAGMFRSRLARRVLIIAPKTLLIHWAKELSVCGLGASTHSYFGSSEAERAQALRAVASPRGSGGIMLTTYGMVLHNHESLRIREDGRPPAKPAVSKAKMSASAAASVAVKGKSKAFGSQSHADSGVELLDEDDEGLLPWDVIVLDEGHKIKNPKMKLAAALRCVPAKLRVIISGTPIQNNLLEMHALFDYCCYGLLGSRKTFDNSYAKLITAGQDRDATERERVKGAAVATELRRIIAPFFLRREKRDVLRLQGSEDQAAALQAGAPASSTDLQSISRKNDLVVWLRLTPLQQQIYQAFLQSDSVKAALNKSESVLSSLTVLKKICDHPGLLSANAAHSVIAGSHKWDRKGSKKEVSYKATKHGYKADDDFIVDSSGEEGGIGGSSSSGASDEGAGAGSGEAACGPASSRGGCPPAEGEEEWMKLAQASVVEDKLLQEIERKGAEASCKSLFVLALLDKLAASGHRTLIFSQSRVMLDILEASIRARGMAFCRIDGTMLQAEDRHAEVRKFQAPGATIPVFMLTSQVGGLGLTLTSADRVIIVDPNWNPAIDNQSVDRAYRIGQRKDVVVYRLITCGTVEEKIYRKQVFKGGLSRTGTEQGVQFRYFALQELRDLFMVTPEGLASSQTQSQLHKLHSAQQQHGPSLTAHLQWLQSIEGFSGVSDHDLLFSRHAQDKPHSEEEGRNIIREMQGRQDADDLSAMMSSSLKLGGGVRPMSEAEKLKSVEQQQARRVQDVQQQIRRQHELLKSVGSTMADGGSKIRSKIEVLTGELQREQLAFSQLHGGAPAGAGAASSAFPAAAAGSSQPGAPQGVRDRTPLPLPAQQQQTVQQPPAVTGSGYAGISSRLLQALPATTATAAPPSAAAGGGRRAFGVSYGRRPVQSPSVSMDSSMISGGSISYQSASSQLDDSAQLLADSAASVRQDVAAVSLSARPPSIHSGRPVVIDLSDE